jgi:hypothetical protein
MSVQLSQALASSTFFLVYSTCQNHPIDRLSFYPFKQHVQA